MVSVYHFDDYRLLIRALVKAQPKKGRGQIEKMAQALRVHPTLISQVLAGARQFSEDQAYNLAQYFKLTDAEAEYLVNLVQLDRAANPGLKKLIRKHLSRLRSYATNLEETKKDSPLTEQDKGIFYSNWYFSGVRMLSSVPQFDTAEKISQRLSLPLPRVEEVLEFLLNSGLCVKENGKLKMAQKRTLVGKDSPFLSRHHVNWRVKAMEHINKSDFNSFFYTSPMSVSEKDAVKIRDVLMTAISEVEAVVDPSDPENIFCLNVDWFNF